MCGNLSGLEFVWCREKASVCVNLAGLTRSWGVWWEQLAEGMSTEGEVMDASGAPVTDELTGVHHSPQRDAIYEPEKTARCKAHAAAGRVDVETRHVHLHNFTRQGVTRWNRL